MKTQNRSFKSGIQILYFRGPTADGGQDVNFQHDPEEDGHQALHELTL